MFKLFFDPTIIDTVIQETNRYAYEFINSNQEHIKPHSRVHKWENVGQTLCIFCTADVDGDCSEIIPQIML